MEKSLDEEELLSEALRLMTTALELLDRNGKVTVIGAHLDLARTRLAEHIQESPNG